MDQALSSAVLDAVIDPTVVIGEDGVIAYFNRAACEAFLMTADDAIGSHVSVLMANEVDAQHMKNAGRDKTVIAKRSDGSTWNASLSVSEVTLEATRFFVGTLRDVTSTMERESLFSNVIDEAIDAIFTINERGLITLVNRSACKMFGYQESELLGQNISMLMPTQHAHQHDQYIQYHIRTGVKKMIGTDRTVTAKRRDNSEFKCRLGLSKIMTQGQATFVGLLHDLTHELAAREADSRAELANKMRKQKALFLASMSHEIRTPLNGIFGMLELLRSTELDEVQAEWLATCSRSAQSLTTILDDILLFSRADGGGITLEKLSFNIRDIVEDAVTVLASQTNDKVVDLVYNVSRTVPDTMIGDPTRLRQVMLIFLSNALKFTSIGHVALEVSLGEDDSDDDSDDESVAEKPRIYDESERGEIKDEKNVVLKFEVSDTGIGMNKKQIKKLFQPFTQADESTTRQYGGTGLGLSIAKKLVDLMEGEIVVESRPNRGSTFTFTALLQKDPDSHGMAPSDLHDSIPEEAMALLKGIHILSIDDNAVNTDYLVNLLKMLGCDIHAARSGADGIEMCKMAALREDPYEILLLDFAMPGMHGLEVAEIVANSQTISANAMRVIMLGSIDVHRSIAACPHVHGFTTKPIRRLPLIKMIVEQLKIKRGMLWAPNSRQPRALREDGAAPPQLQRASSEQGPVAPPSISPNRPNPLSILYVEDNLINQKVMVTILRQWKCNVTTAVNGIGGYEERIAHKGKREFDLILCDLHMPSCDGFQCVKMIREWEEKNHAPASKICAVTADADKETQEFCKSPEGGFNEFLAKPLRKDVLRNMIIKMCGEERLGQVVTTGALKPKAPEKTPQDNSQKESSESADNMGTHVLVVDDSPTMRLLLRTLMTNMGSTVSLASSGEEAVDIVRNSLQDGKNAMDPIELVFCDMRMPPGMNGIETTRTLKAIPGAENLPVIGMTADEVSHGELLEARQAGMVSLVSKPIGKTQLVSYLTEHTRTALPISMATVEVKEDLPVWDVHGALELCGNDPNFLATLLEDFMLDLSTRKEELQTSVQRKDCSRAAEIAHNIKGMAGICNFKLLAKAACECQKVASASDYVAVRSLSQAVLNEMGNALKAAKKFDPAAWVEEGKLRPSSWAEESRLTGSEQA